MASCIAYLPTPQNVTPTPEIVSEPARKLDFAGMFLANRNKLLGELAVLLVRGEKVGDVRTFSDPTETAGFILDVMTSKTSRDTPNTEDGSYHGAGLWEFVRSAVGRGGTLPVRAMSRRLMADLLPREPKSRCIFPATDVSLGRRQA